MSGRPPLPYRWEAHLAAGVLALLLARANHESGTCREPAGALATPELQRWWHAGRTEGSATPWRSRFVLERNVLRGVTSLLLAWRSYRFERLARRR